jgi:hypothetical protein
MADDGDVTWDQLKRARTDIARQIETLQHPMRHYGHDPNALQIARLNGMLADIDQQLARWNKQQ